MRHMFELVVECADDMVEQLIDESKRGKPVRYDMKELFARYSSDVIASCAFGLKVDSLHDRKNEFFRMGKKIFNFNSISFVFRLVLNCSFPKLMRALKLELFPAYTKRFFQSMVLGTMKEREKKQIVRPDMINILMQIRSGKFKQHQAEENDDAGFATAREANLGKIHKNLNFTDDEIVGICFQFFAAGYETASSVLSLMTYELAINQNCQQKLYDEIRGVNASLNGARLSYDTLLKLKYLDQVVCEALRKWPPLLVTTRKCTKEHEFNYDGKKFTMERGRVIWISICSIHHDPRYFENPERFDPERFSDENKRNIKSGSYIPFGSGPRNCMG